MIKKRPLRAYLTFSVTLIASLFLPVSAHAVEDGINLQISPLPIVMSSDPGKTVSSELRVRNAGTKDEKLKVTLRTFRAEGNEGKVVLKDRGPTDAHFDWVKFDRPTFEAPPNVWQSINMKITIPKSAAFGYYYAVQFERETPAEAQPGKNTVEGAIAIFVLLDVNNPGAKRMAEVVSFTADKKFYEFLPTEFSVVVRNTGNVHLSPRGNIFVQRDSKDKEPITTIEINPNGGYVLPKSNRVYKASWTDGFPVYVPKTKDGQAVTKANGQPEQELKWDFSQVPKLRIGSYTANLVLVYDDGRRDVPLGANLDFWVIPWRLIGGGVVIALFVIIGLRSTGLSIWRRWRKR